MTRELKPCGTVAAYMRHLRNDEEACEPCKQANSRKALPYARARTRALNALARRYREAFAALLAEELAKEEGR